MGILCRKRGTTLEFIARIRSTVLISVQSPNGLWVIVREVNGEAVLLEVEIERRPGACGLETCTEALMRAAGEANFPLTQLVLTNERELFPPVFVAEAFLPRRTILTLRRIRLESPVVKENPLTVELRGIYRGEIHVSSEGRFAELRKAMEQRPNIILCRVRGTELEGMKFRDEFHATLVEEMLGEQ